MTRPHSDAWLNAPATKLIIVLPAVIPNSLLHIALCRIIIFSWLKFEIIELDKIITFVSFRSDCGFKCLTVRWRFQKLVGTIQQYPIWLMPQGHLVKTLQN